MHKFAQIGYLVPPFLISCSTPPLFLLLNPFRHWGILSEQTVKHTAVFVTWGAQNASLPALSPFLPSSFGLTILCDAICLKRNQMKRSINHSGERTDATGERTWKSRKRENRLSRYKSRRSKRNGDGERERERIIEAIRESAKAHNQACKLKFRLGELISCLRCIHTSHAALKTDINKK